MTKPACSPNKDAIHKDLQRIYTLTFRVSFALRKSVKNGSHLLSLDESFRKVFDEEMDELGGYTDAVSMTLARAK